MTEFPQRPKMPRAYAKWADKFRDWSVEHAVALVNGSPPSRLPTGAVIDSGCGGDSSTGQQTPFPKRPERMRRSYAEYYDAVRAWWMERRVVIAHGATLNGPILTTTGTGEASAPAREFPAFPTVLKRYRAIGQAVASWCQAAVITGVQGGTIERYPTGTVVNVGCAEIDTGACCPFTTITVSGSIHASSDCGDTIAATLAAGPTLTAGVDFTDPNLIEATSESKNVDGICATVPDCCGEGSPPDCEPDPACEDYSPDADVFVNAIVVCEPTDIANRVIRLQLSAFVERVSCSADCAIAFDEGEEYTIACEELIGTHIFTILGDRATVQVVIT